MYEVIYHNKQGFMTVFNAWFGQEKDAAATAEWISKRKRTIAYVNPPHNAPVTIRFNRGKAF